MGFFKDLGNAFMGRPIGQSGQSPQSVNVPVPNAPPKSNGILNDNGLKIVPDIDVKNLRSYRDGDRILVKAWVFNNSSDQIIRVDTSRLVGQKRTHNQEIGPNNSRELTLYDGAIPRNENEDDAEIAYRLKQNGDVFMAHYHVEFSLEPDGARLVEELHDDGPVRDI